jgi:catechol 2,3-dioxygenase-like lactoylglutathione lyase family enzyme
MLSKSRAIATLPSRDLKPLQTFYGRKLGLERLEGSAAEGYLVYQAGKKTTLMLFESSFGRKSGNTGVTFEVDDLDAEMASLRKKGVEFEDYDLPTVKTVDGVADANGMGRIAWFKDPDGNLIALHESA